MLTFTRAPTSTFFIERQGYSLLYDGKLKQAVWVMEKIALNSLVGPARRKKLKFKEDQEIPPAVRSLDDDYKNSGFDRGHFAPSANYKHSQDAMEETFYFSNATPQNGTLNAGLWNALEERGRMLTLSNREVTIISGPLFLPEKEENGKKYVKYEVIGENHVAVPTHYFKLLMTDEQEEAYIVPNKPLKAKHSLEAYRSTVEKVSRLSGIIFPKSVEKKR